MRHIVEFPRDPHFGIAAELDIGAAASHVRGDGDRAGYAGLGDDEGFLLMVTGVENLEVLEAFLAQALGKHVRIFRSTWCQRG